MNEITEARIKNLDQQLENAVVTAKENDYFDVFVPGAVREFNTVTAKDKEEAIEKTRAVLISKIEQLPTEAPKSSPVEIEVDNLELNTGVENG